MIALASPDQHVARLEAPRLAETAQPIDLRRRQARENLFAAAIEQMSRRFLAHYGTPFESVSKRGLAAQQASREAAASAELDVPSADQVDHTVGAPQAHCAIRLDAIEGAAHALIRTAMHFERSSEWVRPRQPRLRELSRIGQPPADEQLSEFAGEQRREGLRRDVDDRLELGSFASCDGRRSREVDAEADDYTVG